jgi:hypothetical protein
VTKPFPGTVVTYAPGTKTPSPFAFVLNISELAGCNAMEIIPGRIMRRANEAEIKFIKEMLESSFRNYSGGGLWETRKPKSGSGKFIRLPVKRSRYFVIELGSESQEVELLESALSVASCDLEVGFILTVATLRSTALPVCLYSPPRLFQSLSALSYAFGPFKKFTDSDGEQVRKIYSKLAAYDNSILNLEKVFKLLFELKDLPRFSPLQVLGYFSVLESILTHPPKPEDRYDSITRQIRQKLALLNKRWNPPLDYSAFAASSRDKVWPKMYAYRSAIAHGGTPDFAGELAVLGKAENANRLISEAVKKTILQAIEEPQLLADLRNC